MFELFFDQIPVSKRHSLFRAALTFAEDEKELDKQVWVICSLSS